MNKIVKNTLILTVITLVAGLGLGLVYEVTKAPIVINSFGTIIHLSTSY